MKKSTAFLGVVLLISLGVNAYFFKLVIGWQKAWQEQFFTTANIERLYRKSGADVSFDKVKDLVGKEFVNYKIVPVTDSDKLIVKSDKSAILVDGTKLYFKDGQFLGSKANLPVGLVQWDLENE